MPVFEVWSLGIKVETFFFWYSWKIFKVSFYDFFLFHFSGCHESHGEQRYSSSWPQASKYSPKSWWQNEKSPASRHHVKNRRFWFRAISARWRHGSYPLRLTYVHGPRSDYVSTIQLKGWPLEPRYYRLSVLDWKSAFSSANTPSSKTFLREKCKSFT